MKLFKISMLILLLISPAQAVQVIPKTQDDFTCFDYSIAYAKENPDWGIVTISDNQWFGVFSHMVNYQFTENNTLMIHDGLYQYDYEIYNWQDAPLFYHFWLENEIPCRNYKVLQDNSHLFTEKFTEKV